jgi:hypothetical protein
MHRTTRAIPEAGMRSLLLMRDSEGECKGEQGGDAVIQLGDGQNTTDTIPYGTKTAADKQHADKNRWLGGTRPWKKHDTAPRMLLLVANRANCHEPYASCEGWGKCEDERAEARWCGECREH